MSTLQEEVDAKLKGEAHIWEVMLAFAGSMALKSAVELRVADIMHSHGRPITLRQIASAIDPPAAEITALSRIMTLLVRNSIFTATPSPPSDGGPSSETLYGLTPSSRWLLRDAEMTLAPMVLLETHPLVLSTWHRLANCVTDGGIAFKKAHGRDIWDFAGANPEFNAMFNGGMACTARIMLDAILAGYKDMLADVESLVDVGGGTGSAIAEVVKACPHIKGINFDLPHVVATAPPFPGVCHVAGDMFHNIPKADAIFMKWIMHDWGDEDCIKILKNCRKAISETNGKVIIIDIVLQPDGKHLFDETRLAFDLTMLVLSSGGRERTKLEWEKVLHEGGFSRYKIIKSPTLVSIIEAFP
ncbi:desmethylxanthohumol 6'-O-methyltransferase-like [Malania oleifera]|uniref:desmethylxanthohumol 6'-O-methyltransferase-like n=1 Tax=Malania oleifera TaxID=397392 RepID=UPI0025AE44DD|nr:desmethylxanthohumol 6'-O-methyltransferase-like [Malania oleifera]